MVAAKHVILATVVLTVVLVVGFVIGFFSAPTKTDTTTITNPINSYYESLIQGEDNSYNEILIENINAQNIENHLK
jgi:hypothetical protein